MKGVKLFHVGPGSVEEPAHLVQIEDLIVMRSQVGLGVDPEIDVPGGLRDLGDLLGHVIGRESSRIATWDPIQGRWPGVRQDPSSVRQVE